MLDPKRFEMHGLCLALSACCLIIQSVGAAEPITQSQKDFFESKVRPILAQNCYRCHSLEEGKAKGDLTLDTREGLLKGGKHGAVIEPGAPEKSRLIKAVSYDDPDLQMPPKGEKLKDRQIADLYAWIQMGAPDPRAASVANASKLTGLTDKAKSWWAYQPIKKPDLPEVKSKAWLATPVDAFILAKLEANNMRPSPPTAREALIRRAYYDLVGLPPSPQEVRNFLNDGSPDAYAHVVDRLLASQHYGERWGRYWLDTARYADTRGGVDKGKNREDYRYAYAWTYRDYVIKSFNQDTPYDQFILEQLAADKLPETERDKTKLAALGFLTVGERFNNPNDVINDRIDVVTKGFLGMTVACARCHDHKFDPVPTADYYSLHGVFASCAEPPDKPLIQDVKTIPQYQDYQKQLAALEQQNQEIYYRELDGMLSEFRRKAEAYIVTAANYRDGKQNQSKESMQMRMQTIKDAGLDPELMRVVFRPNKDRGPSVFGAMKQFTQLSAEEFPRKGPEIAARIAASKETNPLIAAAFKGAKPTSMADVAAIYGKIFSSLDSQGHAFVTASAKATTPGVTGFQPAIAELLQVPFPVVPAPSLTTEELRKSIEQWPQKMTQRAGFNFSKINELELTHPGAPARAMVINDSPNPHNSQILIRGQTETRGPVVPREFLEVLSGPDRKPFTNGSGRLDLARAIASKDNPLTPRVIVNRVWMHHFGDGFVSTPDDLGNQSELPSHPELLDYLAARFVEEGWSLKKLHRMIMLSNAYQQSSDTVASYEKIDPRNRLLWHANVRRLDFEAQRDTLLVFSGKLNPAIGGQPVNITDEPYSYRRSVYGYIDRGNLPDLMANFDFSDPDMPNSKRTTTVVPQQALFFMNSPMVVDVARKIVARPEVNSAPGDLAKIWALYQIIYQRMPKPMEIQFAQQFLGVELRENMLANAKGFPDTTAAPSSGYQRSVSSITAPRPMPQKEKRKQDGRKPIENVGERVERKPLTVWEEYAQALLLANESAYVN